MTVFLENNSAHEVSERVKNSKGVVIIPVGSTEQHGAHLPLGTDTYVAKMLAEDAAKATDTIVTPQYGSDGARITWYCQVQLLSDPRY